MARRKSCCHEAGSQKQTKELKKCSKDAKTADEQIKCAFILEALRELFSNPKLEITDFKVATELGYLLEDAPKPLVFKKLHHNFQSIKVEEIV